MVLQSGNKVLIVQRRLFEKDSPRFFVGTVDVCEAGLVKVTGYTHFQDKMTGHVQRKDDVRTKVIPIASGTVLVYLLSDDTRIDDLHFIHTSSQVMITDGSNFRMDLTEH